MFEIIVSFIVPVYNTESKLLCNCLDSIMNVQCGEKEIIIIDDGSTNKDTIEYLDGLKSFDGIKIIRKINGGPSSARNTGLDIATGKYVVFLDSDDSILPCPFSELLQIALKRDIDILCFTHRKMENNGKLLTCEPDSGEQFEFSSFNELRLLRDQENKIPLFNTAAVWAKIYKRSVIDNVRFDESLTYCEDTIFNSSPNFKNIKILGVYKQAYNYFVNSSSLTHKYNAQAAAQFAQVINKMKSLYGADDKFNESVVFGFYLHNVLPLEVFNRNNQENFLNKRKHAKKILLSCPYSESFHKLNFKSLSSNRKIIYILLKFRAYWLSYRFSFLKRKNNT